jgi:penicillin-binding protein 1A
LGRSRRILAACLFGGTLFLALPSLLVQGFALFDRIERLVHGAALPSAAELASLAPRCQVTSVFGPETVLCPAGKPLDAFSPHLAAAVIAAEDRRFYWHDGVDRVALLRGVVGLIGPGSPSGGSTLTQQVARTLFLEPSRLDWADRLARRLEGWPWLASHAREIAALDRKRKEWTIARRLESVWDKKQILTAYLNIAPHADALAGFEAAARHLFGKSARELSLEESAMLVAMLPAPNLRHPVRHPDALLDATRGVLSDMVREGFVTDEERDVALSAAGRRLKSRAFAGSRNLQRSARRPFEYRRVRDLAREQAAARGVDLRKARRLFVTLSPSFQEMADQAARKTPAGYDTSAFFTDWDGRVLAMAGPDYGSVQYNAAFESVRSIGSIGKVMLFAAALEQPGLADRDYSTAPLDGYSPREDSRRCRGSLTPAEALAISCNRPFVRLAAALGASASDVVRDFGFDPPDNRRLIATGGVEGNAMMTTRLFGAFANGGLMREPDAFAGAIGADGRVIPAATAPEPRRVLPSGIAERMAYVLRGPVTDDHGTARAAAGAKKAAIVAGKTGTSNGSRDAWFAGFTEDFVGTIVAQARRKGGTLAGGGFPARSFGAIVDQYWTRRNWQTGPAGQAAAATPVQGLSLTIKRVRALQPELMRLLAIAIASLAVFYLVLRRPQARPALAGEAAAGSPALSGNRPPVAASDLQLAGA